MVPRLVEDEDVVLAEHQPREAEPRPLASRQVGDFLLDVRPAEQQRGRPVEELLGLGPARGRVFQVFHHRLVLWQARVDVLGIDPDVAAVPPADFTF